MMKLNCDLGESFGAWTIGQDAAVMPYIDMANIACGFHAGDPSVMRRTVALAQQAGVQIGAHPAYPDLVGFGRRSMACSFDEIYSFMLYQLGALQGICQAAGARIRYVKPHGALYNDMMQQPEVLTAIMQAVVDFDAGLPLLIQATADNSAQQTRADQIGVSLLYEAFADRAYDAAGFLVNRRHAGAVYHDSQQIVAQALALAKGEALYPLDTAASGPTLILKADTLCVHGDNDASLQAVKAIRQALSLPASAGLKNKSV